MTCRSHPLLYTDSVKTFIVLIFGVLLGAGAIWYYTDHQAKTKVESARGQLQTATREASAAVQDKLRSLNLGTNDIKQELEKTGQIVRTKARQAGDAISDATSDARITAAIKARLVGHEHLSALDISVNTTDGVVTLAGAVDEEQEIGQAMVLAMEVDGVKKVISTLQVRKKTEKK